MTLYWVNELAAKHVGDRNDAVQKIHLKLDSIGEN
jgi:hypothetical protein